MSHNTHKQLLTSFWPIPDSSKPPHNFQDSQNQVSTLKLSCNQHPTLDIIYSKVSSLVSLQPCLPVLFIYVYFTFLFFLFTPCVPMPLHLSHFHHPQLK